MDIHKIFASRDEIILAKPGQTCELWVFHIIITGLKYMVLLHTVLLNLAIGLV